MPRSEAAAPYPEPIRPAFGSRQAAAIYCLVLGTLLAAPLLLHALGIPRPREGYREMPLPAGDFAFIERQIFDVTDALDVVFIGSSHVRAGIDTPYFRQQLSEFLDRPARVVTLGFNWGGEELIYVMLRDLLARRKVGTVVLGLDFVSWSVRDEPHPLAFHILDPVGDPSILRGLDLRQSLGIYAGALLGSPRHLLGLLRADTPGDPPTEVTLGYAKLFGDSSLSAENLAPKMQPDPDWLVYGPRTRRAFHFSTEPVFSYQTHFVLLEADLLRKYGVRTIILALPVRRFAHDTWVREAADWPRLMHLADARMIGARPTLLFEGLTDADIDGLFRDEGHFNARGARYFTRFVAPTLFENLRAGP
jgi:hypothetical protein